MDLEASLAATARRYIPMTREPWQAGCCLAIRGSDGATFSWTRRVRRTSGQVAKSSEVVAVARLVTRAGLNFPRSVVAWLLSLQHNHAQFKPKADGRLDNAGPAIKHNQEINFPPICTPYII